MSKIIMYGDLMSQPCRAVAWVMIYGNIPYELKLLQVLKGETRTDEYKKINPFGKIPTLKVDDDRASVDSYLDWHHLNFRKPCFTYFVSKFMLPKFNVATDPLKVEAEAKEVAKALHLFEKYWLVEGKQPFINGTDMSLADISAYCELLYQSCN
ncbi:hypothetical protein PPL_07051 [Heterostelium album PN500]|uniref:Glutathione S-transferase n=1 Tax=Heterostelium pallidum (strain ATCC 26659 / Pp 5 / PN500) TaxID=670386 RepID=D3BE95_HETP5|nr:hypothetical protein PPL_07051 [Heterostelium album PN500]EFA80226.1 hypothetical protein PPL_07051 [Heterostelium album PN500]|eukprot:XP_020432346.1 hypothetical protein PPL_07051 [Heterostelium album PN500]